METSINYTDKIAFFSSDEPKWIRRVHEWHEQLPDYVEIISEPENNDGCIYCKIPSNWMTIRPKKGLFMTEEEKAEIGERLKQFQKRPEIG